MRRAPLLLALLLAVTLPALAQWQILDSHTTSDLRGIDNGRVPHSSRASQRDGWAATNAREAPRYTPPMRRAPLLLALLLAVTLPALAQWQILDSHTTSDLRGIDNVGGGVVWASGSNGTVLRSEDAGFEWQPCAIPPNAEHLDFRGIQAFDANTAIVMSSGKGSLSRRVPHSSRASQRDGWAATNAREAPRYTPPMRRAPLLLALLLAVTLPALAQWQILDSHTTSDLRGIDNVGGGVVWASGSNGTVLRSEDAGFEWQPCAIPPNAEHLDFRGIQAFDNNTAIVMSSGKGSLSRLYKTTDGCQTWTLVFTNPDPDGFWDAIRFEAPNPQLTKPTRRGVLIGDPVQGRFAIFISSDQGNTWTNITDRDLKKPPRARTGESLFAASNSCADAVGDAGNLVFVTGGTGGSRMLQLIGGGLVFDTWMTLPSFEETNLHFPHATESQGAFSVAHRKIDQVTFDFMVVGGDYLKPDAPGYSALLPAPTYSFFVRHQKLIYPITPPHGYRSSVAYDSKTKTWITVGPNGTDISTDDGRNWRALHPDPALHDPPDADQHWNALSLPFVVGPHGRIGLLEPSALPAASR